ncbi:hypothetical protein CHUAL_004601 [Chamberlinius hualienensis]
MMRTVVYSLLFCCAVLAQQSFRDIDDLCLECICQASTGCQMKGCTIIDGLSFCGPYQISLGYWQDAGQPSVKSANQSAFEECAKDRICSEDTVKRYLIKYARNCNKDALLDCDDIARLHKAGPFACDSPDVEKTPYWQGFEQCFYGVK